MKNSLAGRDFLQFGHLQKRSISIKPTEMIITEMVFTTCKYGLSFAINNATIDTASEMKKSAFALIGLKLIPPFILYVTSILPYRNLKGNLNHE